MAKYRKVLDETENVTSINRGFHTKNNCVAPFEQTKKRILLFYPKRIDEADGIPTLPLQI